jgi:hypothetical protein
LHHYFQEHLLLLLAVEVVEVLKNYLAVLEEQVVEEQVLVFQEVLVLDQMEQLTLVVELEDQVVQVLVHQV